jgi:hypothetical protein
LVHFSILSTQSRNSPCQCALLVKCTNRYTLPKVYRRAFFSHNICYYIVVQCCQEGGRLAEPHHNTTPSPLTCHKDRATHCLHCLNVASVPCKTGGCRGKFLLHAPAAAAAYQDKWMASLVRAGRSCLLPRVPAPIPSLLSYSLG